MNINDRMTLILQNAENLYQWVNDQITDEVFYKEKARIELLLYPESCMYQL